MGKQLGALSFKGKFKDAVGYKSKVAKKSQSVFVRGRAESVSNPKTYGQAKQRAKMVPAILFYNAFKKYLNHAFIPDGPAARNYAKFMQFAMSLNEIPDVFKNEPRLPFCEYQISAGALGLSSLAKATIHSGQIADYRDPVDFGVKGTAGSLASSTIAAFSADILAKNPLLAEGMEITILCIAGDLNDLSQRVAIAGSIVLDSTNTITKVTDCFPMGVVDLFVAANGQLCVAATEAGGFGLLSTGMIISAKSGSSWIYTNSKMTQTAYAIDGFDWDAEEVIASYMDTASSRESDKPLQQATNENAVLVRVASIANETYTIADPVTGATYNFPDAAIATMTDGSRRVVVDVNGSLYNYANGEFTLVEETVGQVDTALNVSKTTWNGNPTIDVDRVSF